ncbi:MAG: Gfo/Idh/MocA family oxidoreductase [Dehalococcoidia bacterium]
MSQQTVRVGYIGAGNFSRNRVLPNLKGIPGVELVVVANSTEESSRRVAQEFGFQRVVGDWREVVAAPDVDAIVVGTRTALHHEMCLPILDAGKHLLTMNAIARNLQEATSMYQKAQEKPNLVSLVFPAQFYMREDALMRTLLEDGYVGQVLQVMDYWYTPYFGLGSQFEVAHRWFGDHTRVLGYRKGFEIETSAVDHHGRAVRPESNVVVADLEDGKAITYLHNTIARGTGLTRFEVYGTEGVLVCYAQGQAKEGFFGARAGETELLPVAIPSHLQEAWDGSVGVPVEVDFIAAVRGEKTPSPSIPRFQDGVKLMEFAQAWRESVDSGSWCDLPSPE